MECNCLGLVAQLGRKLSVSLTFSSDIFQCFAVLYLFDGVTVEAPGQLALFLRQTVDLLLDLFGVAESFNEKPRG